MIRDIVLWPDPTLATVCARIESIDKDTRRLADDLLETMYAAPGRGLAAPQVGVAHRLFVMDTGWKDGHPRPVVMINPEIQWRSETFATGPESCLSLPGLAADVTRATEVRAKWTDLDNESKTETFSGFDAICVQHELDHLDGIVTLDRVPPETRASLEAIYAA